MAQNRRFDALDDGETRWQLERAVARSEARLRREGRPFSRRAVNARLHQGEHRVLMMTAGVAVPIEALATLRRRLSPETPRSADLFRV